MSDALLIAALGPPGALPTGQTIVQAMKADLRELLPNNLWQGLRVESTTTNDIKAVEPFVGPVALRAMLRKRAKREYGAAIVESIATIFVDAGIEPVVFLASEGDVQPPPLDAATIDEIVDVARKPTSALSFKVRTRTFQCRAEARLREPLRVGSRGEAATAYFRNYVVSAFSVRDAARLLRKEAEGDGAELVTLHDLHETVAPDEEGSGRRCVLRREGRVFFGS